jgi:hypothetical protein
MGNGVAAEIDHQESRLAFGLAEPPRSGVASIGRRVDSAAGPAGAPSPIGAGRGQDATGPAAPCASGNTYRTSRRSVPRSVVGIALLYGQNRRPSRSPGRACTSQRAVSPLMRIYPRSLVRHVSLRAQVATRGLHAPSFPRGRPQLRQLPVLRVRVRIPATFTTRLIGVSAGSSEAPRRECLRSEPCLRAHEARFPWRGAVLGRYSALRRLVQPLTRPLRVANESP